MMKYQSQHHIHWFLISSFILLMGVVGLNLVSGQISWTPIYVDTSNRIDLWTVSSTGCECPDGKSSGCACCVKPGGCLCSSNPNKCAQCGLEDSCQRSCNVTISAKSVAARSGLSWVDLKSPELEGPTSCWWRLQSAPGQRIEVQIHRILSIGSFDNSTKTCKEGFLQFADGDVAAPSTQAIQLCGENSRFSPPVVLFGDQGMATLYLRIENKSTRSQVLAYVSFSSADDPNVGDPSRGGRLRPHSVCDWTYDNCWKNECILASPGHPGVFPANRRCRYFLLANATTEKILIRFHTLNIPPPPLCSSNHIAIWRKNVSILASLGPPWKTLCQQSESSVEVEGSQALIEFRSGATTSPNLYNGFRASVEFIHTQQNLSSLSTMSPKRTVVTTTSQQKFNQSLAQNFSSIVTPRTKDDGNKKASIDEPLGYPQSRVPTAEDAPTFSNINTNANTNTKPQPIFCGHVFDKTTVREEMFRLKIPKDIFSSVKKQSKQNLGASLLVDPNPRKSTGTFRCRIEFHGMLTDIVQLALSNYKLRGSNCSTQIEVYDVILEEKERNGNKTAVDRLLKRVCGPNSNELKRFTSSSNIMAISVVLSNNENPTGPEVLEGAFRFHDESMEGTMKPEGDNYEVDFNGGRSGSSGWGSVTGPLANSPLMRLSPLPLEWRYSFLPSTNQSILLTLVNSTGHDTSYESPQSKNYCRTLCTTSGCLCQSNLTSLDVVDHLRVLVGSSDLACFCGDFNNQLPVTFESDSSLALIFHSSNWKSKKSFNATYQFRSNKSRFTNFSIFPPSGWRRWREIITSHPITPKGSNSYTVYENTWPAIVPIRSKLSIDLVSEENEKDCRTWNLTVWAEDDKFPNRSYLLSSFCPAEGRKEVKVPDTVRNAFIKLQGVSIRAPQFEVRWKYHDASLASNRLPEKMMSDSTHKPNPMGFLHLFNIILLCIIISSIPLFS